LNCGIQLTKSKTFEKYNVRVLGTQVPSIEWTEDRNIFAEKMAEIKENVAPSEAAYTTDQVKTCLDMMTVVCWESYNCTPLVHIPLPLQYRL